MIIDSHQHFWKYDPVQHAWIEDSMQAIRKDFLPEDLKPLMGQTGVDGCVAVQADQTEEETRFLLGLAEKYPFIKAVVGWIDLWDQNLEQHLEPFSGNSKLVGFRHILQAEKPERMLEPAFHRGIEILQKKGYTYDILIYPKHLDAAIDLACKFPAQKFVVDHLAKPDIKGQVFEPWAGRMTELAKSENVCCKVSGMITEGDWNHWKPADLKPYLDFIFEAFGTRRLLFGSDWPVCLLAGSYKEVYSVVEEYITELSADEKDDVLGNNAVKFYGIDSSVLEK
jgi:L-fuconolactonase